jgi:RNA polymerase sigma factor (sigma-70 family)
MVIHADEDIRKMCTWAARRSAARLHKHDIHPEFEEILEICYLVYTTATRYYDPETKFTFLSYYYTSVKRSIYYYYIRKTGDGNIRTPKPLQTNTKITDKLLRTSRVNTIAKPWQPPPNEHLSEDLSHIARETPGRRLLSKREAEIIKEYYWNGKSYQEIADKQSVSRQRICQLHHQALKRLQNHYKAKEEHP